MNTPRTNFIHLTCIINSVLLPGVLVATSTFLNACATAPLIPYSEDSTPLVLVPASQAGVLDKRGRFREIFCTIIDKRGSALPDYRPCEEALSTVGNEPNATGEPVALGQSKRELVALVVPGVGWDCFQEWLNIQYTAQKHVRQFGFDVGRLKVDAFSGSATNARQIRDAIMAMEIVTEQPKLVLIGYSKGAPDILEAVVAYPEIHKRIAAVVSVGGAVGGSPLANDATQSQLELMRFWPKAQCTIGDGGALESLRPAIRKAWLSQNPLPKSMRFYSLVAYPNPERISTVLLSSYEKLSRVDARNDGQLLFYDQVIPGSTLLGYANADHWALTVPIARSHSMLGSTFVDQNQYPREALLEAVLRFVEEELETTGR